MICLADSDFSTKCMSGFLLRHVVPRSAPFQLIGPLDRRLPFSRFARFGDVIVGVGHGEEDIFSGQQEEILLEVGEYNKDEVNGKFIKLVSCQTGEKLGPNLIRNGALAFQGYTEDYLWVADADYIATPWDDPIAGKFIRPVIDALNALFNGEMNVVVYNIEISGYEHNLAQEEDVLSKSFLRWNKDHLVYLGDPNARIRPRPKISLPIPPPPLFMPSLGPGKF